jgi:hypothetical protein
VDQAVSSLRLGTSNVDNLVREALLDALLALRNQILERMAHLQQESLMSDVKGSVANVIQDATERDKVLDSLDTVREELAKGLKSYTVQSERGHLEREQVALEIQRKEALAALRRAWLERESVASIVGALLLLSFGVTVIVSMFTHTRASQIVTSAFLLILGYFFGQGTAGVRREGKRRESDAAE